MDEEYKKDLENLQFALSRMQRDTNFLSYYAKRIMPHHVNLKVVNQRWEALVSHIYQVHVVYLKLNKTPEKYQHMDDYFKWETMQEYYQNCEDREYDDVCIDCEDDCMDCKKREYDDDCMDYDD